MVVLYVPICSCFDIKHLKPLDRSHHHYYHLPQEQLVTSI
jgi:hypothetical protein